MKMPLMISALVLLAFSCAKKESPVVIENVEVTPTRFDHKMAVTVIENSSTHSLSSVLNEVSLNTQKGFDWKSFWSTLNWRGHVSQDSRGIELTRVLDLGRLSCQTEASQAFIGFFNKASLDYREPIKAELAEKIYDHYIWCQTSAPQSILQQVIEWQKLGQRKETSLLEKYIKLNSEPSSQQLQEIFDLFVQDLSMEKKIEIYKLLKTSQAFSRLSFAVFADTDASLMINSNVLVNLELGDFIDIIAAFRWEVVNTSFEDIQKLFTFYQRRHRNNLLPFEKANLLRSQFELLKSTEAAGHKGKTVVVLLETFAQQLLKDFNVIENYLPESSLLFRFGAEMNNHKLDQGNDTHSILERLLLIRGQLHVEKNLTQSNRLMTDFCRTLSDFGVEMIPITSDAELKSLGCFDFRKNETLKINKSLKMGVFSAIMTGGQNIEVGHFETTLSIVNLTQNKRKNGIAKVKTEQKYNTLALPLIVGIKPLKDTLKFKAGATYYMGLYHLYRDGRELTPGLGGVRKPTRGYSGGNLTLMANQRTHPYLKFISQGGEGQAAAPAKNGGLGVDFEYEEYKVKKWIRSFVGNRNFYLADNRKNKRNLEELVQAATNDENFINIYIDPEYLDVIEPEMKGVILSGVKEVIESEGLMDVNVINVLEILARRSIRKALLTARQASYADNLTELMPELSTELSIEAGPNGLIYENGERGENGEILYR